MSAGGLPFAALCMPLHLTYYLYNGFDVAAGTALHLLGIPSNKPLGKEQ